MLISFTHSGVNHSVLRQVGEGLLSARSGVGAPVAKSVYRGGRSLCFKIATLNYFCNPPLPCSHEEILCVR